MKTLLTRQLAFSVAAAISIASPGILRADYGDGNPTGVAGRFNGNVTTGCSYDPYTGNARRPITDIAVVGSVGAYPLAFTRTLNSRFAYSTADRLAPFGQAGGWRHSYQWEVPSIWVNSPTCIPTATPSQYAVVYPDGRSVVFDTDGASTTPGIGDRFAPPVVTLQSEESDCYLFLADGGQVHFSVTITRWCDDDDGHGTEFDFAFVDITDPYGLKTTITTGPSGPSPTPGESRTIITDQTGRNLTICRKPWPINPNYEVVDRVEERPTPNATTASRTVQYNYVSLDNPFGPSPEPALDNVVYFGDTTLTAHYTYQPTNRPPYNFPYLIRTCNDTMYMGPMGKIAYDFAALRPHGFIHRERYFDGTDANNGPAVSSLETVPYTGENTRQEVRGDGPTRTFTYENGLLISWTDFKGNAFSQGHFGHSDAAGPAGFVSYITEPTGRTDFQRHPTTGNTTQVRYPITPSDVNGAGTVLIGYTPSDPYHIHTTTDERGKITTYNRDPQTARILRIDYPDGHGYPFVFSFEEYQYNEFGQVKRHLRKNGFYEHFQYNNRGQLIYAWNPIASANPPTGSEPKTEYTYYQFPHPWQDRVESIKDPRGYRTFYWYETSSSDQPIAGRGLVSRIIHPDQTYVSFGYDARGNELWEENELRQRTSFIYDDYNRVIRMMTPLPSNGTASTVYDYRPFDGQNAATSYYKTTSRAVGSIQTPTGILTENHYDQIDRLLDTTVGVGSTDVEPPTTSYVYDDSINRVTVTDPRGKITTIDYDARHRLTKKTVPLLDGQATPYFTQWLYDPAGNVREIVLPDGSKIEREYDAVNRLEKNDLMDSTGSPGEEHHRVTRYTYWPSGQIQEVKDPKGQITSFEYDERDLKKQMTYPDSGPSTPRILQGWVYDENGNMTRRPTIGGPMTQSFLYDNRNRLKQMRWSNSIDWSDFDYDDANRLISAVNPYSSITRHYDDGGRMDLERQALAVVQNTAAITITPISVVSRKSHGAEGSFDVALTLTGSPASECRIGPDYSLVLTFANPITVEGATVTSGIGEVESVSASGNVVTVNLNQVSDTQIMSVKIYGLSDGVNTGEITIPVHVLVGDTTNHKVVNDDDKSEIESKSGQQTDIDNFRCDVNADGVIDRDDLETVSLVASSIGPIGTNAPSSVSADVRYEYYADGKVKTLYVTQAQYSYSYQYDGVGRPRSIAQTSNLLNSCEYLYDRSSNLSQRVTHASNNMGITLNFEHDALDRTTEENIATTYMGVSHLYHGYDGMNRLTWTSRAEEGLRFDSFGYSFTGELTNARFGINPNGTGGSPTTYLYDFAGNRDSVDSVDYVMNGLNQYTQVGSDPVANRPQHQIERYRGITYDYLADTRLSDVRSDSSLGGDHYELGYDALGRTVRRTMNGQQRTYSIYGGTNAILEYNSSGALTAATVYGIGADEIIWRDNNGERHFFMQDRMGSTVAVSNIGGQAIERYRYDAFGMPTIEDPAGTPRPNNESAINNRILFVGREWVPRFGFYENRARAYHPGLGRFMSEDPLGFGGGDTNLFRYCRNNPLKWRDPSGLDQRTAFVAWGGGLIVTWGNNNGQSNFGIYGGVGIGLGYSYVPGNVGASQFPGFVGGIQGQATVAEYKMRGVPTVAVNVSANSTTVGGDASISLSAGPLEYGATTDYQGNVTTYLAESVGVGGIVGIGGTWYGIPGNLPTRPPVQYPDLGPPPTYTHPDGTIYNGNGTPLGGPLGSDRLILGTYFGVTGLERGGLPFDLAGTLHYIDRWRDPIDGSLQSQEYLNFSDGSSWIKGPDGNWHKEY